MRGLIRSLTWMVFVGLMSGTLQVRAAGSQVRFVETRLLDGVYLLDAGVDINLSEAALEALDNGVPLTILFDIKILRDRPYWLDEEVARLKQRYRLEYHALSKSYVLVNVNATASDTYHHLDDALTALGTLEDYPLIDQELLRAAERYTGRLVARLDIEKLPAPMRVLAYLSSEWRLTSRSYTWAIRQ